MVAKEWEEKSLCAVWKEVYTVLMSQGDVPHPKKLTALSVLFVEYKENVQMCSYEAICTI